MIAPYAPLGMAAILLLAVLIELRSGKIPNWLTLLPFVLFIITAATSPDPRAFGGQLVLGAVVFAAGLVLFLFAGFGAGAVKLMAGLALFIPLEQGYLALGIFVASLFVSTFAFIALRKIIISPDSKWHVVSKNVLPMSVPLAVTGVTILLLV